MTIAGKYELTFSSDNYEDYLKAAGVGMINRKLAGKAKPTMEYIDHGNGKWTQKTHAFKNFEITFILGVEFDEVTADDRKVKSVVTLDGNTLVHKMTEPSTGKVATHTRVFNGDEMTTTFTCGDVVATRKFKKA